LRYLDGMDVFHPFPHWAVPGERTLISVTVNTVRLQTTFLIPMTCFSTFVTGKLSLTGHSLVSIFLAFKTPQWIRNVDIHLLSKKSYFNGSGKDRDSKCQDDSAVFTRRPSRWTLIFLTSVMPCADKFSIISSLYTVRLPFLEFMLR